VEGGNVLICLIMQVREGHGHLVINLAYEHRTGKGGKRIAQSEMDGKPNVQFTHIDWNPSMNFFLEVGQPYSYT
jgi:hypothetical protein